jgi:hypothetical protein
MAPALRESYLLTATNRDFRGFDGTKRLRNFNKSELTLTKLYYTHSKN